MSRDNLVRMANSIGTFFEAMPDRDEALDGIASHLRRFWAPAMRRRIVEHLGDGGFDLLPIVKDALMAHPIIATEPSVEVTDPAHAAEKHAFDGASES